MKIPRCLCCSDVIEASEGPDPAFLRLGLQGSPGHPKGEKALASKLRVVALDSIEMQQAHGLPEKQGRVSVIAAALLQACQTMAQLFHRMAVLAGT